jgi:hypothetical protein
MQLTWEHEISYLSQNERLRDHGIFFNDQAAVSSPSIAFYIIELYSPSAERV